VEGDTLVITTLDRLGRSTANMLGLTEDLRSRGINLRVLNLGGGDVDTGTPMGGMVFTVMAALAQMDLEINRSASPTVSASDGPRAGTWADAGNGSPTARSATPAT
jgi:DNA invertase Pin-like site-specific DNA recombinase